MYHHQEEKDVAIAIEHSNHTETIGHVKNQEQREETIREALTRHPKTIIWLIFAIFVLVISSFDNQAGSIVVGIPEFRKDSGYAFEGNYVLPAKWQSAYSGGPTASTIIGSIGSGYIGDKIGRKRMYAVVFAVVLIGVTLESKYTV